MPRLNTQLESAGAEFLALAHLLIEGIPAHKAYTNTKGYDLVAVNPEKNLSTRIQVKSRWATKSQGFMIKDFDCDFVVVALLNRGTKDGKSKPSPPDLYVLPVDVIRDLPRTTGWGKLNFSQIREFERYREQWSLIRSALKMNE